MSEAYQPLTLTTERVIFAITGVYIYYPEPDFRPIYAISTGVCACSGWLTGSDRGHDPVYAALGAKIY